MNAPLGTPDPGVLRWQMLERLFDVVIDVPVAQRSVWLDANCADVSLRAELEAMLDAHSRVTGVLERRIPQRTETLRARMMEALTDRYTIGDVLGAGGSATVFRAHEHKHDRPVVLKVLHPDIAAQIGVRRFLREVQIAARLAHPHILPLIDSGEANGLLYYVMPDVQGEPLRDRLAGSTALPRNVAITLIRDVADALSGAHAAGIVHRDLKPENVLCVNDHAFLLDFGIAMHRSRREMRHTGEGLVLGTPGYMSPEQVSGDMVDSRSDVYAWGVLARELLTGRNDHQADGLLDVPGIPVRLAALVRRAMAFDPADRPADGQALLDELQLALADTRTHRLPRSIRRWRVATAVLGVIVVVTFVAIWRGTSGAGLLGDSAFAQPVAVAPLRNETGDSTLEIWGRMAGDWLTRGLHETSRVRVVPFSSTRFAAAVQSGPGRAAIANFVRETGAGTVVAGRYYLVGDRVQFSVEVLNAADGSLIASLPEVSAPREQVDVAIQQLRERLMGVVAVRLDERANAFPGLTDNPPTFAAYMSFDRAMALFNAQQYAASAAEFRQAWSLDTTFVAPLIYAAMAHWNRDEYQWVDTLVTVAKQHRQLLSAYDQAQVDYLGALLDSDGARAIRAGERAAQLAPSSRAAYNLGRDLIGMNRAGDARRVLEQIDPDDGVMRDWSSYWTQLTHALHLEGDHEAEIVAARKMRVRFPDSRVAYVLEARALAAAQRTTELDSLLAITDKLTAGVYWSHGGALAVAGEELMAHGRAADGTRYLRAAAAWLERALQADPVRREHRYWMGAVRYSLGEYRSSQRLYQALMTDYPDRFVYRGMAAVAQARLGDRASAEALLGPAPEHARGEHTFYRARIAAVAGDTQGAEALLAQAIAEVLEGFAWVHASAGRDIGRLIPVSQVTR